MQNKITKPSRLLDVDGELIQKGYATSAILRYHRRDIKAFKGKIKEWDYYLVYTDDFGVSITIGKGSSIGLFSATFFDYKKRTQITKSVISFVPDRRLCMPKSPDTGDILYQNKRVHVSIRNDKKSRRIHFKMKHFDQGTDLKISLLLNDEPKDSMVIATPFSESKKLFYYNQKTIGMKASGSIIYKNKKYILPPHSSFGLLDWGRGAWPYKTIWYWSAAQGINKNNVFGFNLGYGFGDTSKATENMLFFNGIAQNLKDVVFLIPINESNEYDYLRPWVITSSDHRIEMNFFPIMDRSVELNAILLSTDQHQVFGKFYGKAILDDGTLIEIRDMLGFAERVQNKW
ncbi:MAG: hypothetical protein K0S47_1221 [Herbinix sp.]|jgi:hypothetical protein|nr:hypothetical protein [Herbinix sp.]